MTSVRNSDTVRSEADSNQGLYGNGALLTRGATSGWGSGGAEADEAAAITQLLAGRPTGGTNPDRRRLFSSSQTCSPRRPARFASQHLALRLANSAAHIFMISAACEALALAWRAHSTLI